MFKLFSNASIYRITRLLPNLTVEGLTLAMPDVPFVHCTEVECARTGWVMNDDNTPWLLHFENKILIRYRTERREVPKDAIKAELEKRCKAYEERMGTLPRRPEKMALRDEVYQKLLPRAFARSTYQSLLIDLDRQLIFIDTASARNAENALALLRKTLGSMPVVPVCAAEPPELHMTEWHKAAPADLPPRLLLDDTRLVVNSVLEGGVKATLSGLSHHGCVASLLEQQNNVVTTCSLTLLTPFGLGLTLTDNLTFKRLVFASALKTQAQDNAKEEAGQTEGEADREAEQRAIDEGTFILMATELGEAWDIVIAALGGEAKADA